MGAFCCKWHHKNVNVLSSQKCYFLLVDMSDLVHSSTCVTPYSFCKYVCLSGNNTFNFVDFLKGLFVGHFRWRHFLSFFDEKSGCTRLLLQTFAFSLFLIKNCWFHRCVTCFGISRSSSKSCIYAPVVPRWWGEVLLAPRDGVCWKAKSDCRTLGSNSTAHFTMCSECVIPHYHGTFRLVLSGAKVNPWNLDPGFNSRRYYKRIFDLVSLVHLTSLPRHLSLVHYLAEKPTPWPQDLRGSIHYCGLRPCPY